MLMAVTSSSGPLDCSSPSLGSCGVVMRGGNPGMQPWRNLYAHGVGILCFFQIYDPSLMSREKSAYNVEMAPTLPNTAMDERKRSTTDIFNFARNPWAGDTYPQYQRSGLIMICVPIIVQTRATWQFQLNAGLMLC